MVFAIRWHSPIAENMSNETMDLAGHVRDVYPYNWTGFGRFKICETDQPCFTNWWLWFFLVPCGAQLVWVFFYALASRVCCKIKDRHVDAFRCVASQCCSSRCPSAPCTHSYLYLFIYCLYRYLTAKGGLLAVLGKWKNQKLAYFVYNVVNYAANVAMTLPVCFSTCYFTMAEQRHIFQHCT